MIAHIAPAHLAGTVPAIASKSVAHRLIIAATLANGVTDVTCNTSCADIEATIRCLEALGAKVERAEQGLRVHPIPKSQEHGILRALAGATLDCGESGSTLRFMLPVACALGADATFTGTGGWESDCFPSRRGAYRSRMRPSGPWQPSAHDERALASGNVEASRQRKLPVHIGPASCASDSWSAECHRGHGDHREQALHRPHASGARNLRGIRSR